MIFMAASKWPTRGIARNDDSIGTSVAISTRPMSIIHHITPIIDWKYDASSGSQSVAVSNSASYPMIKGLGDCFGSFYLS